MINKLLILKFIILAGFSGCVIPESNHVEPEYHLLTALNAESNSTFHVPEVSFYIREVNLPPYLDDNRLVQRKGSSSINFLENHRWGEPLGEGFARVVGQNLSNGLNTLAFSAYPNRSRSDVIYEISASIIQFEKFDSSNVRIVAVVEIFHKNSLQSQFKVNEIVSIVDRQPRSQVKSLSVCISKISALIAQSIHQLPLSHCLNIKVDSLDITDKPVEGVLIELSEIFKNRSSFIFKGKDFMKLSGDFDSTRRMPVSVRVTDTSLYEIIKIIAQKSDCVAKFSSSGIVFHPLP